VCKRIIGTIICFALFFISSCNNRNINIIVGGAQKELLVNYLLYRKFNVKITDNDNYITLNKINEKILIGIITMLDLKIEIIKNNIMNVNTTRTAEGGAYIRKYLKISAENGMEVLKDDSPARWVYDPPHPDAVLSGTKAGYVQIPNVDLITEYYDLIETAELYNSIVDFIKTNYKNIIVEKINVNTIDEITHNIKIEKGFQLLLEFSLFGVKKTP
jgi:flagellar basal-body rod protein FlgC